MLSWIFGIIFVWLIIALNVDDDRVSKENICCKLRDKSFVPQIIVKLVRRLLFSNFYKKLFDVEHKRENLKSFNRLFWGIVWFFFPAYVFIKIYPESLVFWGLVQFIVIYWIIKTPISVDICDYCLGKALWWVFFLCVVGMTIVVWLESLLSMLDCLGDNNVDDALININFFLCLTIASLYFFYSKWSVYISKGAKELLWNALYGLNIIIVLFAFGMLNLVYVSSGDKSELASRINQDSPLLYFTRSVYVGAVPAIYGKEFIDKSVSRFEGYPLINVYKLGMNFSYDDMIVLDEFLFMVGYIYLGYRLKPNDR